MAKTASEKLGVQGLGWIVRRARIAPSALTPFYVQALGLRQLRPAGPTGSMMLWMGDITMFELSNLTPDPDSQARAEDFSFFMRTRDYAAAKAAVLSAGARVEREETASGRTLTARDPDGLMFGLWEADHGSTFPPDAVSDAMWKAGLPRPQGAEPLPNGFQDVASINLKVADPVAMAAFYHDALGLELLGAPGAAGATLSLGRTTVLELHPGGLRRPRMADRNQYPDVWILRVYDQAALTSRLREKNATILNEVNITGGRLVYALDPEGHIFGLQQRTPDLLPSSAVERVEDVMARRLWAETKD
jgi:predicted enzyme related to lactoylglutathione lyase